MDSSPLTQPLPSGGLAAPPLVRISIIPFLAGPVQRSARSEMSRLVAAAWCVYFLLLFFCLKLLVRVAPRQPGVSHRPPRDQSHL